MSLDIATNILDNLFPPLLDYQRGHLAFDFGKEILSFANDFHSKFHPSFVRDLANCDEEQHNKVQMVSGYVGMWVSLPKV